MPVRDHTGKEWRILAHRSEGAEYHNQGRKGGLAAEVCPLREEEGASSFSLFREAGTRQIRIGTKATCDLQAYPPSKLPLPAKP